MDIRRRPDITRSAVVLGVRNDTTFSLRVLSVCWVDVPFPSLDHEITGCFSLTS
jgi:hypothetical protein